MMATLDEIENTLDSMEENKTDPATRIIKKIKSLKGVRGPEVSFFINVDKENGITYQGMVGDWSQELIDENRLFDFENMIDNMYNVGIWE